MEIFLWALEKDERELVKKIVTWGKSLEGNLDGMASFEDILAFYNQLEKNNELNSYHEKAHKYLSPDKVIFTGYLGHEELRYLYPCCKRIKYLQKKTCRLNFPQVIYPM